MRRDHLSFAMNTTFCYHTDALSDDFPLLIFAIQDVVDIRPTPFVKRMHDWNRIFTTRNHAEPFAQWTDSMLFKLTSCSLYLVSEMHIFVSGFQNYFIYHLGTLRFDLQKAYNRKMPRIVFLWTKWSGKFVAYYCLVEEMRKMWES